MIKFSEFFESWAHQNYYKFGVDIGKKGDFYTSISVGWLFGVSLANYFIKCIERKELSDTCAIVEIGANDGMMMADFIQGIFTLRPSLLKTLKFIIIEPHDILRKRQFKAIKTNFADEINFTHFTNLSEFYTDEAFFISNELFDSFSCEVFDLLGGEKQLFVNDGALIWSRADKKDTLNLKKIGFEKGEVCFGLGKFASEIFKCARRIKFITFDYGEWAWRGDFSVRVYKDHNVFNLFEIKKLKDFYGISDITYDVCFSHLAREFEKNGFKMVKFKRQNEVLIDDFAISEIMQIVLENGSENVYKNAIKQLKFLTHPNFLGDRFKFVEFDKNI
ncbi:SAM-dependent methyltransferase [Campylobacter anatolicus]|uniref:SAM-dependent methyltransferase n=1 Tax=Campylobacter anatolicus TaxID=2829105 RepID=UPI001E2E4DB2|nr:SAM-dependent methyltransferase [Campylobacter anatolicus]